MLTTGRLASTAAGAGKRRLFVLGNYVKQRLLYPVHDWAMRILGRLPSDGTYDQGRPQLKKGLLNYGLLTSSPQPPLLMRMAGVRPGHNL